MESLLASHISATRRTNSLFGLGVFNLHRTAGGNRLVLRLLPPRVLGGERRPEEIEEIAGLVGRFMPIRRRRRKEVGFQFVLSTAQSLLVRIHIRQESAKLRGLLRSHPAMLIEVDRPVGYDRVPRRFREY